MPSKKPTATSGYDKIEYDLVRGTLTFRPKLGGVGRQYLRVPPEVFYGMPSGQNVQAFIECKLHGRYTYNELRPPPAILHYPISGIVAFNPNEDETWEWHLRPGEPQKWPEDPEARFQLFSQTLAQRQPDKKKSLQPRDTLDEKTAEQGELDEGTAAQGERDTET